MLENPLFYQPFDADEPFACCEFLIGDLSSSDLFDHLFEYVSLRCEKAMQILTF